MGKHTIIIFMSLLVLSTEALAQETKDKQVSDSVDLQESSRQRETDHAEARTLHRGCRATEERQDQPAGLAQQHTRNHHDK